MSDELDDYFRCVANLEGWTFDVGLIRWSGPHTPTLEWVTYRRWKTLPTEARLQRARDAALRNHAFFRTCELCHEITNIGHMHNRTVCQGCAESKLGVVH
jgi:hypothetical protein